jgi:hypothetical protein
MRANCFTTFESDTYGLFPDTNGAVPDTIDIIHLEMVSPASRRHSLHRAVRSNMRSLSPQMVWLDLTRCMNVGVSVGGNGFSESFG